MLLRTSNNKHAAYNELPKPPGPSQGSLGVSHSPLTPHRCLPLGAPGTWAQLTGFMFMARGGCMRPLGSARLSRHQITSSPIQAEVTAVPSPLLGVLSPVPSPITSPNCPGISRKATFQSHEALPRLRLCNLAPNHLQHPKGFTRMFCPVFPFYLTPGTAGHAVPRAGDGRARGEQQQQPLPWRGGHGEPRPMANSSSET